MTWFVLSLGAAVTQATQFAVVKGRGREIPPLVIVTWTQGVAFLAWLAFFLLSRSPFTPPGAAWPAVAASAVLVLGMGGLLARASAHGDISIVGPVFALSPIFTVLPDFVLSGTVPSPLGWLGLVLAVTGTFSLSGGAAGATLNMGATRHRGAPPARRTPIPPLNMGATQLRTPIPPLLAVFARRDALDALGAAVLLGFLAAVDRWAALAIGAPSYLLWSHGTTAAFTLVIVLLTTPRGLAASVAPRHVVTLVTHGLLGVTGTGMQTTALTMAPAAYVNAIRRMSSVIAVVLGRALFRESDVGRRLLAALLASAGAACLLLAH
jgi:drug/metabolite transporter (DMT)-like permease